jgi:hypothetical protein
MVCDRCNEKIQNGDYYYNICDYCLCEICKDNFIWENEFTNDEE